MVYQSHPTGVAFTLGGMRTHGSLSRAMLALRTPLAERACERTPRSVAEYESVAQYSRREYQSHPTGVAFTLGGMRTHGSLSRVMLALRTPLAERACERTPRSEAQYESVASTKA